LQSIAKIYKKYIMYEIEKKKLMYVGVIVSPLNFTARMISRIHKYLKALI